MSKIIGVTVGTPLSPNKIWEKVKPKVDEKVADVKVDGESVVGENGIADFTTDGTLMLDKNNVLRVNTADGANADDVRPITAQGVYNEFSVINALLKTI